MRRKSSQRLWSWAGMLILAGALIAPARAQDPDDQKRGVARISVVQGDVSVQRGDSGEWVAATMNTPLLTNDHIATGASSRGEVQFDGANLLRMGGEAEVSLTQLEYGRYQMGIAHGTVTYRVLRNSNIDIEVDTPSVSVRPSRQGAYRIAVTDSGETEVTARSGEVEVFSPHGSQWVRSGQTLMARGSASDPEFQIVRALPSDEWDRWNDNRDQTLTRSASGQYVGPGIYGTEDLDPYGNWVNVPGYGYAWHPLVVDDWAPYRQGRWVWEDWYGWTWVSYEPWGWAPYHYGRWFYEPAYGWCWYPGIVTARHYWSPALVAFFGFGGGGVSVAFGNVGWVPLAPYEVFHPWWGRGYYGGATYINRSVNITNVNITNVYRNARVQNGFTAVSGTDFQAGRFNNLVRPSGDQLRTASSVRGPIPVAPERANLQFSERQSSLAPRPSANTKFFTREQPSPAPRLSFNDQRRGFGAPTITTEPSAVPNRGGFSPAAPQIARQPVSPQAPAVRNDGGWQRFGDPRSNQPAARTEATPAPAARGWGRFGGETNTTPRTEAPQPRQEFNRQPSVNSAAPMPEIHTTAPQPSFGGGNSQQRYVAPTRTQSLPISPPVVRDRPSGNTGGAGFGSPRGGSAGGPRNNGGNGGGGSNRGGNRGR